MSQGSAPRAEATSPAGSGGRGPYKKSSATRRRIIDAAIETFSEKGFRNGSTSEVAARAGISGAQVFYYFRTKEELLRAVLSHHDAVADEIAGPAPDDGDHVQDALLRIAQNNEMAPGFVRFYMVLLAEATEPEHPARDSFRERYRGLRNRYAEWFRLMEDEGLLAPGVDAEYAAKSTLALWDGIKLQWLLDPEKVNVVDELRRHLTVITAP